MRAGLGALPTPQRQAIALRVAALAEHPTRPVLCPMLDEAEGACQVYEHRPAACRSYGFYVQRGQGLYCQEIQMAVANGALDAVVWGNHDAVDRSLAGLGEVRDLVAWFAQIETAT